jgi:hypothetical protein
VLKEGNLNFHEGDTVIFKVNGQGVFYGYVFKKSRNKGNAIKVLAYDQLRYFKNKHTYVYKNKRADELLQMLANDFNLKCGTLENTGYTIANRIEDDQTLFDIMQNAIDDTVMYSGKLFVLWDDFGYLRIRSIGNRKVDVLIDDTAAEDFDYSSSIEDSYNKIQIYDDTDAGVRQFTVAQNGEKISKWGILQKTEKLNKGEVASAKAKIMLNTYCNVTRSLSIKNAFGDCRVRAGVLIPVTLNLGDVVANTYMLVETAKHEFNGSYYTMDLTLRGNNYTA